MLKQGLDPQCSGYSYAFPVCRLYGPIRQGAPIGFAFRQPDPSAARTGFQLTKIDATIAPKPGQPEDLCFVRVLEAADVSSDTSFSDFLVEKNQTKFLLKYSFRKQIFMSNGKMFN